MARNGELVLDATIKDQASVQAGKIADELEKAQNKIAGGDEKMAKSASAARLERQKALPVNQKLKFELEKLGAAGNKSALATIKQKESLALAKREAKLYLKANEAIPPELMKQMETTEKLSDKLRSFGGVAKKGIMALGAAAAAAATALGALSLRFAANADAAIKNAERMGLTVEQFTGLDHALQISGTSMEEMKPALTKLNKLIRDAAMGSGEAAKKFDRVGVSATNADGSLKDINSVMFEVANKFKDMPNGAEKSALAIDLFEESGTRMVQFLNLGKEGIQDLLVEADDLGLVIGEQAARDAELFNDSLTRMKGRFTGIGNAIATQAVPQLEVVLDHLGEMFSSTAQNATQLRTMVAELIGFGISTAQMFVSIGAIVKNSFDGIRVVINSLVGKQLVKWGKVLSSIGGVIGIQTDQLENMGRAFLDSAKDQVKSINATEEAAAKRVDQLEKMKEGVFNVAKTYDGVLVPATKRAHASVGKTAEEVIESTGETVTKTTDKVQEAFDKMKASGKSLGKELKDHYTDIATKVVGVMSAAGSAMGDAFAKAKEGQDAFTEGLKAFGKTAINMMIDIAIAAISTAAVKAMVEAMAAHQFIPFAGYALGVGAAAAAGGWIKAMMADVPEKMNRGGVVQGPNVNRDVVPILATPGEMILPRDLTQQILRLGGQNTRTGFNKGGVVSSTSSGALVVNINEQQFIPRSPSELDKFVRDRVVPSLRRLQRRGAY